MLRLGSILQLGGAFVVVVACLATAQAQVRTVATSGSTDNGEEYVAPSPVPDAELVAPRSSTDNGAKSGGYGFGGYEQGPTCGCNAYAAPSCGCEVGCGCADACCCEGNGCDCCCIPGCSCGWYGGGEVIWMKPHWNSFDALQAFDFSAQETDRTTSYDYVYDPTVRLFAGYTGCNGLGVRADWWKYDHDSAVAAITAVEGPVFGFALVANFEGATIASQQSLELQLADFEFTNCFEACGGNIVVSFGARYAKFDLRIHETLSDEGGLFQAFEHQDRFEGVGPTVGLEFYRPLCCSGLSFYSNLRGSVIFGNHRESDQRQQFDDDVEVLAPVDGGSILSTREGEEARAIADVQIALQYSKGSWFARGGWQAQYWDSVASSSPINGRPQIDARSGGRDTHKASLGMEGFFIAIGAQY